MHIHGMLFGNTQDPVHPQPGPDMFIAGLDMDITSPVSHCQQKQLIDSRNRRGFGPGRVRLPDVRSCAPSRFRGSPLCCINAVYGGDYAGLQRHADHHLVLDMTADLVDCKNI